MFNRHRPSGQGHRHMAVACATLLGCLAASPLAAQAYANCSDEVSFPTPKPGFSRPSGCPARNSVVTLEQAGVTTLRTDCDYEGVRFRIIASGVTLDCNGQLLDGRHRATASFECDPKRHGTCAAISVDGSCQPPSNSDPELVYPTPDYCSDPEENGRLENITIRNCYVDGYERGVVVFRRIRTDRWKANRRHFFGDEMPQKAEVVAAATCGTSAAKPYEVLASMADNPPRDLDSIRTLSFANRERAPQDITIEDVHVRGTQLSPFYLNRYVSHSTVDGVTAMANKQGPGLYLESESQFNTVRNSCFSRLEREGIAIDSSAYNVIAHNDFYSNGQDKAGGRREGGIYLYKNAYEYAWKTSPRVQHSHSNTIRGNHFYDEKWAIYIASRSSREYFGRDGDTGAISHELHHADPVMLDLRPSLRRSARNPANCAQQVDYLTSEGAYYRDYAEANYIVDNWFYGSRDGALRIADDWTWVEGNHFVDPVSGSDAILLGNDVRDEAYLPLYGLTLLANEFSSAYKSSARVRQTPPDELGGVGGGCALGSLVRRNTVKGASSSQAFEPVIRCDAGFAPRAHPALLVPVM